MGRLDTCYAPVRRSPSEIASYLNAAPRLACVKPVASVHPEPGSNSSLYNIFSTLSSDFVLYIIRYKETWLAEYNSSILFRMTVRTCFSCTTISVYGIMSKNYFSSCLRDSLDTLAGALVSRLRVQRYNNSANHQNITATFFKKIQSKSTIHYNNLCARILFPIFNRHFGLLHIFLV